MSVLRTSPFTTRPRIRSPYFRNIASSWLINFGVLIAGIPSRGGPPERIEFNGILLLSRLNPFLLMAAAGRAGMISAMDSITINTIFCEMESKHDNLFLRVLNILEVQVRSTCWKYMLEVNGLYYVTVDCLRCSPNSKKFIPHNVYG